jgi:FAD/FMN-containing dehydrogenase
MWRGVILLKAVHMKAEGKTAYIPKESKDHNQISKELKDLVGEEFVADDVATAFVYSRTMCEFDQYLPEFVAVPRTTEEVSGILKIANKYKIPVQCQVRGLNMGDCHMSLDGGIIIDLRRMNSILEINEDSGYALCEAGVTYANMRRELNENHPGSTIQYGFMPAQAGFVSNSIVEGHLDRSCKYGASYYNLLSAEVVLPTGEIAHVGARGLVNSWNRKTPAPDLLGLFLGGWYGTTGIITKAAMRIIPRPKYDDVVFVTTPDIDTACALPGELARTHLFDGIGAVDWRCILSLTTKMSSMPKERPDGFPETSMDIHFSSQVSEEELEFKRKMLESIANKNNSKVLPLDAFGYETERFCTLPMVEGTPGGLGPFFSGAGKGSGLSWIGGLGEDKHFKELYMKTLEIYDSYSSAHLFPQICMYEMDWGHVGCFRTMVSFDRADPSQVEKVRNINREMVRLMYDHGYTLYKAPKFAEDILMKDYADEGFLKLMKKVKETLDPNGIMAPKRWDTEES